MAQTVSSSIVDEIGDTAGAVWRALSDNGPLTVAKLLKKVEQPRDTVMQAVGWLAREGKITIIEERRNRVVALR
ncbi:MAG: winged helix-turn-helix domain-containing protein [Thermoguttaceae bacterium]|jgi:hypothetical protein